MSEDRGPRIDVVDERALVAMPTDGHMVTAVVSVPPHHPGTPPHRHAGPVYGYVLTGEMLFELEGDPPEIKRAGDPIWEPGGDRIHYQAANVGDVELRFVTVMVCRPDHPMLTPVSAEEIEARRHLRHAGPTSAHVDAARRSAGSVQA